MVSTLIYSVSMFIRYLCLKPLKMQKLSFLSLRKSKICWPTKTYNNTIYFHSKNDLVVQTLLFLK